MPSWNIHTAHVEQLFAQHEPARLGIDDANSFLFGNYAPDIYVGFMVPQASLRIDYCVTHVAQINLIPVANADLFWDLYIGYRTPTDAALLSLTLGAWAHLVADRYYNGNFRTYWKRYNLPGGDVQRIGKQADFERFGHSLRITQTAKPTPQLMKAAYDFKPYRILAQDVDAALEVATDIVASNGRKQLASNTYQLLSEEWLTRVFAECTDRLEAWLLAWQRLQQQGKPFRAADIRAEAGLPPATPDVFDWQNRN